jgi:serine protease Do
MHLRSRSLPALVLLTAALACGRKTGAVESPPPAAAHAVPPMIAPAKAPEGENLANLVDAVKSVVVNVEVVSRVEAPQLPDVFGGDDFFERFFGQPGPHNQRPRQQLQQGAGSGFIIRADGLVLTNNHVVAGAQTIRVRLDDGRTFPAKVLGRDPLTDVAVIQIEGDVKNLPVAALGDSDALRVGDGVLAIGNPFGLASSVSAGIVSAKARHIGAGPYDDFLQTDAAINPGNSGGPLFNMRGEVVGMNTAIVGGGTGIGFAVPSNMMKALLPQLEKTGEVTRGWLGVSVQDLTPELAKGLAVPTEKGALVSTVTKGAPAERGGLKPDDVVVAVDGQPIDSSAALTKKVALKQPGTRTALTVFRGGKREEVTVTLGTRPNLEGVAKNRREEGGQSDRRERYGLAVRDVPEALTERQGTPAGAQVIDVVPGSAADRAELQPGMIIIEAAGKQVRSAADLERVLSNARPGQVVLLRVQVGDGKLLRALTIPTEGGNG